MEKQERTNPHLVDLFRTALSASERQEPPEQFPPRIVVNGSHNVLSWGGSVHVHRQETSGAE